MQDIEDFKKFLVNRTSFVIEKPAEETMRGISDMATGEPGNKEAHNAKTYLSQFAMFMSNHWLPDCRAALMKFKAANEWSIEIVPAIERTIRDVELDVLIPSQIRETNANVLFHAKQLGRFMIILLDDGELDSNENDITEKVIIEEIHSKLESNGVECKVRNITARVFGPEYRRYIEYGSGDLDNRTIIAVEIQIPIHHLCIEFL